MKTLKQAFALVDKIYATNNLDEGRRYYQQIEALKLAMTDSELYHFTDEMLTRMEKGYGR